MAKVLSFKKYPNLLCNHEGAQFVNIGYSMGTLANDVPYEAELWYDDECLCIGIVMPYMESFGKMNTEPKPKTKSLPKVIDLRQAKKEVEINKDTEGPDFSMLCIGMVDDGEEAELQTIKNYVEFLEENGVVLFVTDQYHGDVKYRINEVGNSVVEVMIILKKDEKVNAIPGVEFKPFPNNRCSYNYLAALGLSDIKEAKGNLSNLDHNKPLNLYKLKKFAEEWLEFCQYPDFNIYNFAENKTFADEAWDAGLQMDCAHLFVEKYPNIHASEPNEFIRDLKHVDDIQALGNCIFTYWRHFHGWIENINDSRCYQAAFKRLLELINERNVELPFPTIKCDYYVNIPQLEPEIIGFHFPSEEYGCFSNWFIAPFEYASRMFSSTEQFMMYHKVLTARNWDLADQIMNIHDPAEIKELAGPKYFKEFPKIAHIWDKNCYTIMKRGIRSKFMHHTELMDELLRTGNAILVECAKSDKKWACGCSLYRDEYKDISKWTGENRLGRILMELRAEFKLMQAAHKCIDYIDARDLEPIKEWLMKPGELMRIPYFHNTIRAYEDTLPLAPKKAFRNCWSFAEIDTAMRTNMGGGFDIWGFYEMKQDIYDIARIYCY